MGVLNKEIYLKKFLSTEGNLINVINLISEAIADINEFEVNGYEIERAYLESEKNVLNVNGMLSLMKLLENINNFLSIGNIESNSNSRNKLFKSLIFLKSEGVTYENYKFITEFLNVYQYQIEDTYEEKEMENYKKIIEKYFDDNKIEYVKDFEFKICKGNYIIEPGFVVNICIEEDYSGKVLKGRINLNHRYLKVLNYDVLNISWDLFKEENKKKLDDLMLAKINEIVEFQETDRIFVI